jgi:hypothetical protein
VGASLRGLVCVLCACGGCALGEGTGAVNGNIYVRGCTSTTDYGAAGAPAPYQMNPTYFVADPVNDAPDKLRPINHLEIRVQPTGNRAEEADVFFLNVANDWLVASSLGTPLAVGPDTNVRVTLALNQTCLQREVAMELDGTVTFSAFGSAQAAKGVATPADFRILFGDRLAAIFSLDLVDRRAIALGGTGGVPTDPALAGHLAGNFDFLVRQGKSAQAY